MPLYGAGAVVNADVPDFAAAVGVPAKIIRIEADMIAIIDYGV